MTLMMIPWPLMNITLLSVHEPVTFPGCDRWWPLMMDDDPMTLMNIMMNMMTIILLPVHEPVTIPGCDRWRPLMMGEDPITLMNIMMTFDEHNTPTRTWASYFPGCQRWWPLLMDDEYYDDQWQWCWPQKMNLWYFQRWDFASHNIYWAFLSSMQQKHEYNWGGTSWAVPMCGTFKYQG